MSPSPHDKYLSVNKGTSTTDLINQGDILNGMLEYQHDGVSNEDIIASLGQIMGILDSRNESKPNYWLK